MLQIVSGTITDTALHNPVFILDGAAAGIGTKHFSVLIGFALALSAHDVAVLIFYAVATRVNRGNQCAKKEDSDRMFQGMSRRNGK